jgi:hypothetical protein
MPLPRPRGTAHRPALICSYEANSIPAISVLIHGCTHTQTNTWHARAHAHGSAQSAGEAWGSGGSREEGCKSPLGLAIDKNAHAANARTHAQGHVRTHAHGHVRSHAHGHVLTHAHGHVLTHAHGHVRTHAHGHVRTHGQQVHVC